MPRSAFDVFREDRKDVAIDEVEDVNQNQNKQDVVCIAPAYLRLLFLFRFRRFDVRHADPSRQCVLHY